MHDKDLNAIDWVEEKRVIRTMLEKAQARIEDLESGKLDLTKIKIDPEIIWGVLIALVAGEAGAEQAQELGPDGQNAYNITMQFRPLILSTILGFIRNGFKVKR